ncbi:MAG: twin-arginine translocation signal domain-containing protein, partial [Acidobacteria bacterium]|nr:twin-arginine translocation signal domain-containing protein [Acidobacteriota bacterium]
MNNRMNRRSFLSAVPAAASAAAAPARAERIPAG